MAVIPWQYVPADVVRDRDPVTGASFVRRRRRPSHAKTDSHGGPVPATCSTPFCVKAGQPHDADDCAQHRSFDPYYNTTHYHVPAEGYESYHWPVVPHAESGADSGPDYEAFQRWLRSFPHWRIPREIPPDWDRSNRPHTEPRHRTVHDHYSPRRPVDHVSPWALTRSVYTTPWANSSCLPNRAPSLVQWNDVQGGKLTWTPHPWVAHPLPHPDMPAQAFWSYPGSAGTLHPWQGPGGWLPTSGLDTERMNWLTGGHPLPGMDPYWTPTRWVPPVYSPRNGVYLSPWLAPSPRNSSVPHVLWDASVEPPYRIRRVTGRGDIAEFASTDFFKSPATYPPVKTMHINLPCMRKSWGPVVIQKDSQIEVGDVFKAVWNYLQQPITQDDWQAIYNTYGVDRTNRIGFAMYRRCLCGAGLYDYLWSQGVKRVDLMEGSSVYWGTYLTYNVDGTWSLTMAFLPHHRTR